MPTPHETRVLNLIAKVDITSASLKKRQIVRLLKNWPSARAIRAGNKCHCRRGSQWSFRLPETEHGERLHTFEGEVYEDCGFWCPYCGFSNAGARPVKLVQRIEK